MPWDDPRLLVVPGSISSQLQYLGSQVLHDCCHVHWSPSSNPFGIVALSTKGIITNECGRREKHLSDVNVFINFQLTSARAKLLEEVKKERKAKRINSYGVDQNGRVTMRVGKKQETGWSLVTSSAEIQHAIANPAPLVRRHQR